MKKIFNKRIKLIIFTIALFIVINIALSFSYLSGKTINNESVSTVALKAGNIQVRYTDNSGVINATGISPGYSVTKQFTVTSEYGETHQYYEGDLWYTVSLFIEKNEFDDNSLKYSLSLDESSDNDGLTLPNLSDIGIPTGVNLDGLVLGSGMFKSDNKSHKYNLTISYRDNGEDQSHEIDSEFKAYMGLLTPDMNELTIDLDGGSINTILLDENSVVEVPANSRINLPSPQKELKNFAGWEVVSGGASANNNVITTNLSDISLKAIWVPSVPYEFDYTGGEQEFIAENSGYYKIETWGAQGATSGGLGGYGSYSIGEIKLLKNNILYVNVGGAGLLKDGGYNGGGSGSSAASTGTAYKDGGGGGGATHIATIGGTLSSIGYSNIINIIIVSGGGGGGSYISGNYDGGAGGGLSGNVGSGRSISVSSGNQDSGYAFGLGQNGLTGSSGYSWGESGRGGGGGGLWGGYASQTGANGIAGGGGGSGYIGNPSLTNKYMYCYNCTTSDVESTKTYTTTCAEETPTENCSKIGNGYARITYLHS